ncbi:MAG: GNAT family N-acetyltransferase [Ignavibacteria bacterium]|jgi:GNAT superfamily N-acetyltransferase|nr:GNAT family N-acetyltransferase [Ignavibacteria bacterium]MCU7502827.1 GNAT family N-acetyltransferase [Ignavibacteria bacterium]MCU7515679.1 GNAT family N-acetyltransferase [Ignavibacteria bacterium]
MDFRIQENCEGIDWLQVREYLKDAGMGYYEAHLHEKAFRSSYAVVFVFNAGKLAGFGRAISDGAYQAAIYDVVVLPEFRDRGLGRLIISHIIEKVESCNIILYASPGKEGFYSKLGFSAMKTGMARFLNPVKMKEKGMI